MTELCLVRHGQTDWNLQGRYQGQSDVSLNQNGLAQARTLARQIQGQTFAAIYSSDLKRAKETALIIATAMHLPVIFDARLREINQGEWEGQLVDIIRARYENLWQKRSVDPASLRPPGGETVGELAERIQAALDDIVHLHPGLSVLIVSHGLALATALCKVRGIPIGQAYTVIPENAQPVWVEWGES
ncbi:MAG: histidine phosphatase family protein [Anaerolineales bacterium]|jgi:broad specificity phosphatase PhoE